MTTWRDVKEEAKNKKRQWMRKPVRVLGLDGADVQGWGEKRAVVVAADLGAGEPVAIGYVDEHNPDVVRCWIEPLVKRLGVRMIVTDDLVSFKKVAEKLGLEHQICQFHLRRWVGRTLYEQEKIIPIDWLWVIEEIRSLLVERPPEWGKRLFEIWKQIPARTAGREQPHSPQEQLRYLLIRLSEYWPNYRVFDYHKGVPWTNNG